MASRIAVRMPEWGRFRRTRTGTTLGVAAVGAVVASLLAAMPVDAVVDPSVGTLDGLPGTTPESLAGAPITDLQFGDPAENVPLIAPPATNNTGSVALSHPLPVPPGRGGIAPSLELTYDSSAGASWVGTGWDLDVGAITVDTTFGAPLFDAVRESESYALDGARLAPDAIAEYDSLALRSSRPTGFQFTRVVEGAHERIRRHGTSPSTYYWEVTDKAGTTRWYGGSPVGQSADVLRAQTASAVFHWPLTLVVDINGNTIAYDYETTTETIAQGGTGTGFYLTSIEYTGFTDPTLDQPSYRVLFQRDGAITPAPAPRRDVEVDARNGAVLVASDLLRRVVVQARDTSQPTPTWSLVRGFSLNYDIDTAYGKALLSSVDQYGTGGHTTVHASHVFDYYDEVRETDPATGALVYRGFADEQQWAEATASAPLNIVAKSAIGTSERGGGDGGAYIGFNPTSPSKLGSFGGSINIAGGQSVDLSTMMDLDGDGLPDLVEVVGSQVQYRRNISGPTSDGAPAAVRFAGAEPLQQISTLGRTTDITVHLAFEAYPVASIQVGGGFSFDIGSHYFTDANADGRPDLVQPGSGGHRVYFNVLQNGVPTFVESSATSPVPLANFPSNIVNDPVAEVQDLMVSLSPRIDTVRRWIAPFTGTVQVTGNASLPSGYLGDGVRLTIEHGGSIEHTQLLDQNTLSSPVPDSFGVTAGDAVYFRAHVGTSGAGDEVTWAPVVTYVDGAGTEVVAATDANLRSQTSYSSADDYTTFGRVGSLTRFARSGPATVTVTVRRTGALTDDVDLTLLHRSAATDAVVSLTPTSTTGHMPAGGVVGLEEGTGVVATTYTYQLTAGGPVADTAADGGQDTDWLALDLTSDTPVDPSAFTVEASAAYDQAAPGAADAQALRDASTGDIGVGPELVLTPNVQVYGETQLTSPYTPYSSDRSGEVSVTADVASAIFADPANPGLTGTATLSAKSYDDSGVLTVVKSAPITISFIDVPATPLNLLDRVLDGSGSLTFDVEADRDYWVELTVHHAGIASALTTQSVSATFTPDDPAPGDTTPQPETASVSVQRHWSALQGVFPAHNRGWGIAGYNADHEDATADGPIVPALFEASRDAAGGHDEDTEVPDDPAEMPSSTELTNDPSSSFDGSYPYLPLDAANGVPTHDVIAPVKETLRGNGSMLRPDRLGQDVITPGAPPQAGSARFAPELLGASGDFSFTVGLVAGFSIAAGGGRTLRAYDDFNGDGFPDIRVGSQVEFTGPRGDRVLSDDTGAIDLSTNLAVSGSLGISPVNAKWGSITPAATGANDTTSSTSKDQPISTGRSRARGMNVGVGLGIAGSWTNPIAGGTAEQQYSDTQGTDVTDIRGEYDANAPGVVPPERSIADINGDGLPDLIDVFTDGRMFVRLGLGYDFAPDPVLWANGRYNASETVSGSLNPALGFQYNSYEFGGGVGYTESVTSQQFAWMDLDGDGVPDRMERFGNTGDEVQTVFGAGGNPAAPIVYGDYPDGSVDLDVGNVATLNNQLSMTRTTGLTGGVDFTIYVGPLCLPFPLCYLIINPGGHGGADRTTTQISLTDVNGDGYPDIVKSENIDDLRVRLNRHGRTDLLQSVTTPIGGQYRFEYERTGNTVDQPQSRWVMSGLEVDDMRPGDGPDIARTDLTYDGNVYDRLHRVHLGHSTVVEEQFVITNEAAYKAGGPAVRNLLRRVVRTYHNESHFERGLMKSMVVQTPSRSVRESITFDYDLVQAQLGAGNNTPAPSLGEPNTPARTALFGMSLAPRLTAETFSRTDPDGDTQSARTEYGYNEIGDVTRQLELFEEETASDNLETLTTYSQCGASTYVSVPQTVLVKAPGVGGEVLRYRASDSQLCTFGVPKRVTELQRIVSPTTCVYARTDLDFDVYGSYDAVRFPTNAVGTPEGCTAGIPAHDPTAEVIPTFTCGDAATTVDAATGVASGGPNRYCVDYTYDPVRFTDVATVTDVHGVQTTATYDLVTGRLSSSTDPNGNTTDFRFDAQGRLSEVLAPRERAARAGDPTAPATLRFQYGMPTDAHAWATVRHHDAFAAPTADDSIVTVAFVDGVDRVTQRKREAEHHTSTVPVMIVEGAVEFDALGREVKEWYPITEPRSSATLTTYNQNTSASSTSVTGVPVTQATVRTYDVLDRLRSVRHPDLTQEEIRYDIGEHSVAPAPGSPPVDVTLLSRTMVDGLDKATETLIDARGLGLRIAEFPAPTTGASEPTLPPTSLAGGLGPAAIRASANTGAAPIVTAFAYDRLGRLATTTDTAGAVTTHGWDAADNIVETTTPDAGRVNRTYTPFGELAVEVDPVRRSLGQQVSYSYDHDRLVRIEYPSGTPDVTYRYGGKMPTAAENTAAAAANAVGRLRVAIDGAMTRTYGYDVDGNISSERAQRIDDPFGQGVDDRPKDYTTGWTYDSLSRLRRVDYPDGEVLTYDFDAGGLVTRMHSRVPSSLSDPTGAPIGAPVDVVYVESIDYDEFLQPRSRTTGTAVTTTWDFEPTRRMISGIATESVLEQTASDGTTSTVTRNLLDLAYTYDAVGNVTQTVNGIPATDENRQPRPSQHAYVYDQHYRLVDGIGAYQERQNDRAYGYEADYFANGSLAEKSQQTTTTGTTGKPGKTNNGNGKNDRAKKGDGSSTSDGNSTPTLTCETSANSGGGSFNQDTESTYTLAAGDLVYTAGTHRLIRAANRTYTYDLNGNVTSWTQPCAGGTNTDLRTMQWDAANRLVELTQGSNSTEYRYTGEGNRSIEKGPGGLLWFVNQQFRVHNAGHQYKNIMLGSAIIATNRTDVPSVCDPALEVCTPPASVVHMLHADVQGSTRVITDETGRVYQALEYLPTGEPWAAVQSSTDNTPYLFAGGWTDQTYDLVNFGERWYDNRVEQFYSPEPVLVEDVTRAVVDPSVLAAYTYAASNPLRYVDPSGRYRVHINGGNFELIDGQSTFDLGAIDAGSNISTGADWAQRAASRVFRLRDKVSPLKGTDLQTLLDRQATFKKHKDRADTISTILDLDFSSENTGSPIGGWVGLVKSAIEKLQSSRPSNAGGGPQQGAGSNSSSSSLSSSASGGSSSLSDSSTSSSSSNGSNLSTSLSSSRASVDDSVSGSSSLSSSSSSNDVASSPTPVLSRSTSSDSLTDSSSGVG